MCRAILCVSAFFAVGRCPFVCMSVTFVYFIQTSEDIVKRLFRPGSSIILVFLLIQCAGIHFQGEPFSGGVNYTGVEKK